MGMKQLPGDRSLNERFLPVAIGFIPQQRMSGMGRVHPNLVGPAGVQLDLQKTAMGPGPHRSIPAAGRTPALRQDRHLMPGHRVPPDPAQPFPLRRPGNAFHKSQIPLPHFTAGKGVGQRPVRHVILRRHHHPARVLIQPVNDSRSLHTADSGKLAPTVVQQRRHQRPPPASTPRVNDHPRCLINHDKILILIKDLQGQFLRFHPVGLRIGNRCHHPLARLHARPAPQSSPIHFNPPFFQPALNLGARFSPGRRQDHVHTGLPLTLPNDMFP